MCSWLVWCLYRGFQRRWESERLAQDKRSSGGKQGLGILGFRIPGPREWELERGTRWCLIWSGSPSVLYNYNGKRSCLCCVTYEKSEYFSYYTEIVFLSIFSV